MKSMTLSNGIPVVFEHDPGLVATFYWWNRVGSCDEGKGQEGFAHFLEHMLFKDAAAKETGRPSEGKMARAIEGLGGDINAYTSFDQTVYHVTCAEQHLEKVLENFGPMAKPQRFLNDDFRREREVVLEELRKNKDSPGRMLYEEVFKQMFSKHPYGRTVIGYEKTLKAATTAKLEAFYRANYASSNMGLIVVAPLGEGREEKILAILEKHFGQKTIARRTGAAKRRASEPSLRATCAFKALPFDVKASTLVVGFRVPDLAHEDIPALDLMSSILGLGELSRLYRRCFYEKSLVTDISSALFVPLEPGMMYVHADFDDAAKAESILSEVLNVIDDLKTQGPTVEELQRVLTHLESEKSYSTQTVDGMASRIGFLHFQIQDPGFDERYLDAARAVTPEKVADVARRYLIAPRMGGVLMHPKALGRVDVKRLEQLAESRLGGVANVKAAGKTAEKSAEKSHDVLPVEQWTTSAGIRVVFHPRPNSKVFSVYTAVQGGTRLELADPISSAHSDWGASHLIGLTWTKGTLTKDSVEIARLTEGRAAELDGFSGKNSIGLELTGLRKDWEGLSKLMAEVLFEPSFVDSEIAHSVRVVEDSMKAVEENSGQMCGKLFTETLFEDHPYGKWNYGSKETIERMTTDRLLAVHRRWVRPDRLVVSISGAMSRHAVDEFIHELDHRARHLVAADRSPAETVASERTLVANRWVERALGREQIHIMVGGLGLRIHDDDRFALRILHTLLGGQGGRLFVELREKKSLAYTVAPTSFEGIEPGYLATYIACAPQKREEALKGIRVVYEKLGAKAPGDAEMKRAKEFFLGRRAMDLQGDNALASFYGAQTLYGIPLQTEAAIRKRVMSVTAKDIQALVKKYILEPKQVTSVVG